MADITSDLAIWCTHLKSTPPSVRRALKRLLITKEGRARVSDSLELELFPDAPWLKLDEDYNPPKEWIDG